MNKLILYIFSIIILIALWFIFFTTSPKNSKLNLQKKIIETSKDKIIEKEQIVANTQTNTDEINASSSKLANEIKALLEKAEKLLENSQDEEAIKIYNLILEKTAKTDDPKLLEYFTTACMTLAYIYQIYPNIDNDAAMEAYNMIINKFEKNNDPKSIQYYIDAKLQLSYLLPYDERSEIYNELLSKYENNSNKKIQDKIENLLINKSFQLMGKDDEEAMSVLDKVIEKYQNSNGSKELPENISISILNNIELALITNNDSESYVDMAKKLMSNSPDTKPLLDMLEILKNAQELNQDEAFAKWKEEHNTYNFPEWSFQEVERWAYRIEDQETKERVTKYINAFINQKYNTSDKYSNTTVHENSTDTGTTYSDPYAKKTNEDINEDEPSDNEDEKSNTYEEEEPDPYAQEIYDATGEYPDPYE